MKAYAMNHAENGLYRESTSPLNNMGRVLFMLYLIGFAVICLQETANAQSRTNKLATQRAKQNNLGLLKDKRTDPNEDDKSQVHQLVMKLNFPKPDIPIAFDALQKGVKSPDDELRQNGLSLANNVWITQTEAELSKSIETLSTQINITEEAMLGLNNRHNYYIQLLQQADNRITSLNNYVRKLSNDLNLLQNRVINLSSQIKRGQPSLSSQSQNLSIQNQISQAQIKAVSISAQISQATIQIQQASSTANDLKATVAAIQAEFIAKQSERMDLVSKLQGVISKINDSYLPCYNDELCINALYEYNKKLDAWTSIGPSYFAIDNLKLIALNVLKHLPIEPHKPGSRSFSLKSDKQIVRLVGELENRKSSLNTADPLKIKDFEIEATNFKKNWEDQIALYKKINDDPFVRGALRELTRIKGVRHEIMPSRGFSKLIEHANDF